MSDDLSGFSLIELFRAEAESQTQTLSAGLLSLERGDASAATLESLMRAAHSIKGAARIVGLDAAVSVVPSTTGSGSSLHTSICSCAASIS